MKRFALLLFAVAPLVFGVAGCEKAHKAGNDSMSVPGGRIHASKGRSAIVALNRPAVLAISPISRGA
jgi:predicted small secreted protein